jgi:hypothetical protein
MRSLVVWLIACGGADPTPDPTDDGSQPSVTTPSPVPQPTPTTSTEPGPPMGIPDDTGITYAGTAVIDMTPVVTETWSDDDGNGYFSGGDSFDDVDGDGELDAVWIGGFGPLRPANGVHDPVYARTVVIARDGEYLAWVALDYVGLGHPRIWEARDRLAADGFDPTRLLVSSSHNHQGPDTMGLWGNPLIGQTGVDWAYQEQITDAIEQGVRDAIAALEPVDLTIGRTHMRDRSPWLSGADFGGKNPVDKVHGMIYDGRDPVLASDQLLVLQGVGAQGTVFTMTNWSGHPEVWGSENLLISSDWVGVTRTALEAEFGGVALHVPESLGGMQSALGADLPLILDDGTHVDQICDKLAVADPTDAECFAAAVGSPRVDADGDVVPAWAERKSWEFVASHGWHIAEAAIDALAEGEPLTPVPLRVEREPFVMAIENVAYNAFGPMGIFDMGIDEAITDLDRCPEAAEDEVLGCFEAHTFRVQLGELGFVSVPGELLPELAWGFPDDAQWRAEVADPAARGAANGAIYFPQHPDACTEELSSYDECVDELQVGTCDCRYVHAWPYTLSDDPTVPPLLDHLDTEYRAIAGMTDSYFSYIIPEPDFNTAVSLFAEDGDHYEDTVSAAHHFGTLVQDAQQRISDRW